VRVRETQLAGGKLAGHFENSPQAALARPVFGRLYTRYDTIGPKAVAIFARIAKVACVQRSAKLLSLNR
jgi:hypothetical protein